MLRTFSQLVHGIAHILLADKSGLVDLCMATATQLLRRNPDSLGPGP
jgi:hypothetical protein